MVDRADGHSVWPSGGDGVSSYPALDCSPDPLVAPAGSPGHNGIEEQVDRSSGTPALESRPAVVNRLGEIVGVVEAPTGAGRCG
jgi:hypothetical protein